MTTTTDLKTKVADEVWIATAMLHREHPLQEDFSIDEIVQRVRTEKITSELRPGVYVHAQMHSVANRAPNPGRYRMLYEPAPGRRRLYRPGDSYDRNREGSKTVPLEKDIPEQYHALLKWYANWSRSHSPKNRRFDTLLALRGSAGGIYGNPDEYVRRLRQGWE